ncbi:MAG: CdvA-like protein [Candidatus Bathyarchaeota archaeon]
MSKLISWKNPFERLNEEYELTQKKKEALDRLLDTGKISQSTYDSFNTKIDEAIVEIEKQQKILLEKMNSKAGELEKQIKILETLLANFEIRYVTGEIEEEVYQREIDLLTIGLETAKQELDGVKEAVGQLSNDMPIQITEIETPEEPESPIVEDVEIIQAETEKVEETSQLDDVEKTGEEVSEPVLPEPPSETVEAAKEEETVYLHQDNPETSEEEQQETWQELEEETTQAMEEETQLVEEETTQAMEEETQLVEEETTQAMEEETQLVEEDEVQTQSVEEETQQTW